MKSAREIINIALVVMAVLLAPTSAFAAQVVDINRADAATMIENWKGIGEKKARAIVSYRKSNGPFGSVDDLGNVKGIGDGIIKNNRKYMSVTKGAYKPTGKTDSSSKKSTTKDATKSSTTKKKNSTDKTKKKSASDSSKKSTDSKSTSKKSTSKESTSKKSSSKKTTKKASSAKKSSSKKSKTKKCKTSSTDKNCVKKSKKTKKKTT